jgi:phosphoribosylanthranilate isomerase
MGALAAGIDERIFTVGVSVDLPRDIVCLNGGQRVDIVQLHGHEDADYIASVRECIPGGIIQAFRIRERSDVERALASAADMVLLDAGQGCGQTFDWSLVDGFGEKRPFILAGGLTPGNVADAIRTLRPWGVDMSSGVETARAKDPTKMAAAVAAVRSIT